MYATGRIRNGSLAGLIGLAALYWTFITHSALLRAGLANLALAFLWVTLAFALNTTTLFMKLPDGQLSPVSYLICWPFFVIHFIFLHVMRLVNRENSLDEIIPDVYVGAKIWGFEAQQLRERQIRAVLDVTAELSESRKIVKQYAYLCIPVLDSCPPTLPQLHHAVTWIAEQLAHGGVFVHCAGGHGRSATVVAAYLLYTNQVTNVQAALNLLQRQRPKICVNAEQVTILQAYHASNQMTTRDNTE